MEADKENRIAKLINISSEISSTWSILKVLKFQKPSLVARLVFEFLLVFSLNIN